MLPCGFKLAWDTRETFQQRCIRKRFFERFFLTEYSAFTPLSFLIIFFLINFYRCEKHDFWFQLFSLSHNDIKFWFFRFNECCRFVDGNYWIFLVLGSVVSDHIKNLMTRILQVDEKRQNIWRIFLHFSDNCCPNKKPFTLETASNGCSHLHFADVLCFLFCHENFI